MVHFQKLLNHPGTVLKTSVQISGGTVQISEKRYIRYIWLTPPLKIPEHDLKWPIFGHFWPFLGQMFRISQNCTRPPEICTLPFIFVPSLFKNFLICFNTFWNRSTCFSFEIIGAQYDFKSLRAVLKLLEQVQFWIFMFTKCHTCAPSVLPHEIMIFFVKMRFII